MGLTRRPSQKSKVTKLDSTQNTALITPVIFCSLRARSMKLTSLIRRVKAWSMVVCRTPAEEVSMVFRILLTIQVSMLPLSFSIMSCLFALYCPLIVSIVAIVTGRSSVYWYCCCVGWCHQLILFPFFISLVVMCVLLLVACTGQMHRLKLIASAVVGGAIEKYFCHAIAYVLLTLKVFASDTVF